MKSYRVRLQKREELFFAVVVRIAQSETFNSEKIVFIACDTNQKKYVVDSVDKEVFKSLIESEIEAPEELEKRANNLIRIWERDE